ncbi:MAG: sensor histidine kinase [Bacteroidota bacterium]
MKYTLRKELKKEEVFSTCVSDIRSEKKMEEFLQELPSMSNLLYLSVHNNLLEENDFLPRLLKIVSNSAIRELSLSANLLFDDFAPVINWFKSNLLTEKMVNEIQEGADRIANLVKSIKTYSHMDQSLDKQELDLHLGIASTLDILRHKIKVKGIEIDTQFDPALTKITGYPGELNQVWTNIIDNAIDASPQKGKIQIITKLDKDQARISFIDNGPGIPKDIQEKIFDPFFTTKAVGEGTGLGLDVVQKVINHQHLGSIKLETEPGRTAFLISIPVK